MMNLFDVSISSNQGNSHHSSSQSHSLTTSRTSVTTRYSNHGQLFQQPPPFVSTDQQQSNTKGPPTTSTTSTGTDTSSFVPTPMIIHHNEDEVSKATPVSNRHDDTSHLIQPIVYVTPPASMGDSMHQSTSHSAQKIVYVTAPSYGGSFHNSSSRWHFNYHRPVISHYDVMNASAIEELKTPRNTNWTELNPHNRIVAFYNLYLGKPNHYPTIVEEQINLMNLTGLLDALDVIYYVTIENTVESMPKHLKRTFNTKKNDSSLFVQVRHTMHAVDETLTLSYLYDFCVANPDSKVLYFHDKGSYHNNDENKSFRQFLDCYVLNPQCIDALEDGFDTCGWRLSPVPSPHYSGNFWWARCEYVRTLVHPASMVINSTFIEVSKGISSALVSQGRYFAESWVSSHPRINPADCMDHEVDTSFFCCYDLGNIDPRECPNHSKHFNSKRQDNDDIEYEARLPKLTSAALRHNMMANNGTLKIGGKCKAADVFTNGQYYAHLYADKRGQMEHGQLNLLDELRKRSMLWYGQEPMTLINATERLLVVPPLPERAVLVEPSKHLPYFYYQNGSMFKSGTVEFSIAMNNKDIPHIEMYSFLVNKLINTGLRTVRKKRYLRRRM